MKKILLLLVFALTPQITQSEASLNNIANFTYDICDSEFIGIDDTSGAIYSVNIFSKPRGVTTYTDQTKKDTLPLKVYGGRREAQFGHGDPMIISTSDGFLVLGSRSKSINVTRVSLSQKVEHQNYDFPTADPLDPQTFLGRTFGLGRFEARQGNFANVWDGNSYRIFSIKENELIEEHNPDPNTTILDHNGRPSLMLETDTLNLKASVLDATSGKLVASFDKLTFSKQLGVLPIKTNQLDQSSGKWVAIWESANAFSQVRPKNRRLVDVLKVNPEGTITIDESMKSLRGRLFHYDANHSSIISTYTFSNSGYIRDFIGYTPHIKPHLEAILELIEQGPIIEMQVLSESTSDTTVVKMVRDQYDSTDTVFYAFRTDIGGNQVNQAEFVCPN